MPLRSDTRVRFLERELREACHLVPGEKYVEDMIVDARLKSEGEHIAVLEEELRAARGRVINVRSYSEAREFLLTPTVLGADCTYPPGLGAFS